jgi:predicted acylesterase/phospholipase RssA
MSATKTVVKPRQTVLILQGGGALGAFQGGVFEALHGADLAPDWVIGTSIGAINAALIAGNRPARRLEHLYEFWARVGQGWFAAPGAADSPHPAGALLGHWTALATMAMGLPNFFVPRWPPAFSAGLAVPPASAGIYDTAPLRRTLQELVDFDYLNAAPIRLTVGAVDVESGQIRYFDSREDVLGVEHIMASSALPPAFPPVEKRRPPLLGRRHPLEHAAGAHAARRAAAPLAVLPRHPVAARRCAAGHARRRAAARQGAALRQPCRHPARPRAGAAPPAPQRIAPRGAPARGGPRGS